MRGRSVEETLDSIGTNEEIEPLPGSNTHVNPLDVRPPAGVPVSDGSILVVDDELHIRRLATRILEGFGYRTAAAGSGEEALAIFARHAGRIQCAMLDLMMPGLDGVETAVRLRAIRPDLPLVVSSGCCAEDVATRFKGISRWVFLAKPYSIELMRTLFARLLDSCPVGGR